MAILRPSVPASDPLPGRKRITCSTWEEKKVSVKELGQKLYLDSGTLTPVLKSLEAKGFIMRSRSKEDERVVCVFLSDVGAALEDRAVSIPGLIQDAVPLTAGEKDTLMKLLNKILAGGEE